MSATDSERMANTAGLNESGEDNYILSELKVELKVWISTQ